MLGEINEALQQWCRARSASKGIEEDLDPRCNLYTFGSRTASGSTAPPRTSTPSASARGTSRARRTFRSEWTGYEGSFYLEMKNHPGTDQVVAVPDAVVPELKLVFRGFEIDIAYVCMGSYVSVPEDLDVCQTSILQNLDDRRSSP